MSLLNDEAIKVLLIQDDVLSEQGKLQSIWDMFTENVDYENSEDDTYRVILKNTDGNVIRHLLFGDGECIDRINKFHNLVLDIKKEGVSNNILTNFMYSLDNSLSEYLIKDNSNSNTKINMDDNLQNPSYKDQSIIISAMLRNGLIDSTEVQSLLDNQNFEMIETAKRCMSLCSKGESPLNDKSSGVHKSLYLNPQDFGTDVSKLLSCVEKLITDDEDLFPNSPSEVRQLLFPSDDFDSQVLYSQDAFISNKASYGIISATLQYIQNSFDLDNDTAIYVLSSVMNKLKDFMNECNKSICLLAYMSVGIMVIRYLKNRINESEDSDTVLLVKTLKENIANAYSMFNKMDKDNPSEISDMIRIPPELKDFVKTAGCEQDNDFLFCETIDNFTSSLDTALNDILSSIEEIGALMEDGDGTNNPNGFTLSSSNPKPISSPSKGRSGVLETITGIDMSIIESTVTEIHSELNRSLLEEDFETAAKKIALELALVEQVRDNQLSGSEELIESMSVVERDITTYKERVDLSSNGISNYMESARSIMSDKLGKKMT